MPEGLRLVPLSERDLGIPKSELLRPQGVQELRRSFVENIQRGGEMDLELHFGHILQLAAVGEFAEGSDFRNRLKKGARDPRYLETMTLWVEKCDAILEEPEETFSKEEKKPVLQLMQELEQVSKICGINEAPQFSNDELNPDRRKVIVDTWQKVWPDVQAIFDKHLRPASPAATAGAGAPASGAEPAPRAAAASATQIPEQQPQIVERLVLKPVIRAGAYTEGSHSQKESRILLNEDSFFWRGIDGSGHMIAGVFDGVGGSRDGALASNAARQSIEGYLLEKITRGERVSEIELQDEILPAAERDIAPINEGQVKRASTTATVLSTEYIGNGEYRLDWVSVGDSRLYVYSTSQRRLIQVSKDQSAVADIVDEDDVPRPGYEGQYYKDRHKISDALGLNPNNLTRFTNHGSLRVKSGDFAFLMSDGETDPFTRPQLEKFITTAIARGLKPNEIAKFLVGKAREDYKNHMRWEHPTTVQSILNKLPGQKPHYNPRHKFDDATVVAVQFGSEIVRERVAEPAPQPDFRRRAAAPPPPAGNAATRADESGFASSPPPDDGLSETRIFRKPAPLAAPDAASPDTPEAHPGEPARSFIDQRDTMTLDEIEQLPGEPNASAKLSEIFRLHQSSRSTKTFPECAMEICSGLSAAQIEQIIIQATIGEVKTLLRNHRSPEMKFGEATQIQQGQSQTDRLIANSLIPLYREKLAAETINEFLQMDFDTLVTRREEWTPDILTAIKKANPRLFLDLVVSGKISLALAKKVIQYNGPAIAGLPRLMDAAYSQVAIPDSEDTATVFQNRIQEAMRLQKSAGAGLKRDTFRNIVIQAYTEVYNLTAQDHYIDTHKPIEDIQDELIQFLNSAAESEEKDAIIKHLALVPVLYRIYNEANPDLFAEEAA